jgi:hypothetical protein
LYTKPGEKVQKSDDLVKMIPPVERRVAWFWKKIQA